MNLHIVAPRQTVYPMQSDQFGYFTAECNDIEPGTSYFYQPDGGKDIPDPASAFQPQGVHGASVVVDHGIFKWNDHDWRGKSLSELIIYELHTGTFSAEGTFDGIIGHLNHLLDLGINAIELMPVSQFPGQRNWGYDGVYPYAVQNSYGGPDGLKRLVDACHKKGIAVILDVVYNHLGPEGNYLAKYAPYFSSGHQVPWGDAVNFDQEWCDPVRAYFKNNITSWIENYHIDGLRLDAIHTIHDANPVHIFDELNSHALGLQRTLGRQVFLIAESDLNDPKVIRHPSVGGYGFNGQWLDDFHHALVVLVDPNTKKRYEDFGSIYQLAKAFSDGFVLSGEYVRFRKKKYGASSAGIDGDKFIAFVQNHDQVGNRVLGERLSALVSPERQMIAAAAVILSPYVPMLFMGEEYAEDAPFMYFVDHSDPALISAVREGRKKDFKHFGDEGEPWDAQDESTFKECKLKWSSTLQGHHAAMLKWYKALIQLRKARAQFRTVQKNCMQVSVIAPLALAMYRFTPDQTDKAYVFFNFSTDVVSYALEGEGWTLVLDSSRFECGTQFVKKGSTIEINPVSVVVFERIGTGNASNVFAES
jgi:maltooligosyltrehalose trehalohydrolase